MSNYDVDLFVIGAGSGGVRTARIAASLGARVAIAEKRYYGGTCVNVGCVPKKLMTYLADYASSMQDAKGYGWDIGERTLDWRRFISLKNKEIERLNSIYESLLDNAGVTVHWGEARIESPNSVRVGDDIITAKHILIATGSKAKTPDIEGAKEHGITSDEIFYLKDKPKKLVVSGVGYIGLEFAGIFNRLDTEVHVIYRRNEILNESFDKDVRTFLHNEMSKKGVNFHPETNITKVEKTESGVRVFLDKGDFIDADEILFATGRSPNTDNLNLEKVGVELDKSGAIPINKDEQTSIPSIYALGDVTKHIDLTPVATARGQSLAERLYGNKKGNYISYDNIPSAIFSDPNVSQVGLTEQEAQEKHPDDIDIYKSEFKAMRMILAGSEERTLMKLIVQRSTDKVLGLHMIGESAGEIVQGFATAIIAGATKSDFDRTIGIHPTSAEELVTMRSTN